MHQFYKKIFGAKAGREEDMVNLIEDFTPLLRKYGTWIDKEDGVQELTVFFIELVKGFPIDGFSEEREGQIVSYIQTAMRHHTYSLKKNDSGQVAFDEEVGSDRMDPDSMEEKLEVKDLLAGLTEVQQKVLIDSFWNQYSDAEIGARMGISRQAVHRTKQRALRQLREHME